MRNKTARNQTMSKDLHENPQNLTSLTCWLNPETEAGTFKSLYFCSQLKMGGLP